jgi:hypothetical protein
MQRALCSSVGVAEATVTSHGVFSPNLRQAMEAEAPQQRHITVQHVLSEPPCAVLGERHKPR